MSLPITSSISDLVNRCLGYGDPDGHGFWFIGVEEQLGWDPDKFADAPAVLASLSEKDSVACCGGSAWWQYDIAPPAQNPVDQFISKIACVATNRSMSDWSDFRRNSLYRRGSRVFLSNLWPVPKKDADGPHPEHHRRLFPELVSENHQRREDLPRSVRWPALRQFIGEKRPSGIVCFGKGSHAQFCEALMLQESLPVRQSECAVSYKLGDIPVHLTRHFAKGYFNKCAQALGDVLRGGL